MKGTLVNLNVNPCKMCMPMGAVTAFYGIRKCMSILHGSQGCSTYIRRHMATHYNEPVDIASSALTEEGTVYGGEKNLIKGLKNLITVYEPEVIAVETTCLAETIGENIEGIIEKFYMEYPEYKHITIIPVPSAGFAGTQFEGYQKALYQLVKTVDMDTKKHNKVNVVTSLLSPADTRYLKELLEEFSIDYILLPDLSENLDEIYKPQYEKLPSKGTDISDVKKMAGALMTIELSTFTNPNYSVAEYLFKTYGVPYKKCNLPVSLRDNDALLKLLSQISGKKISEKRKKERGRFMDAMVDGHKYNGEAKAAIYGEPDFVYSTVRLCAENGIMPVITATGSKCLSFQVLLKEEIEKVADIYLTDDYQILDEVDFGTIEELVRQLDVNILIGNSDGRRIAEKLGLDLIRRSFPIHDRVGGQRLRTLGYEGALSFLDDISNAVLARKTRTFRKVLYDKYFHEKKEYNGKMLKNNPVIKDFSGENLWNQNEKKIGFDKDFSAQKENDKETKIIQLKIHKKESDYKAKYEKEKNIKEKNIKEKTAIHPCFNCGAHEYARIHLPVAPKCNISCNYCVRKYDCPNESRPGVASQILTPKEAFQKYMKAKEKVPKLSVVGIAGPGDALANFKETRETLKLIREQDKEVTFCISTNGLMLPQYAADLIALGVSHVTVTMNAVDPEIGSKIYKYVDYMGNRYFGKAGSAILLANQLAGIRMLHQKGVVCKVNIVMLKGINEDHIPEVVKKVKEIGGTITNIMQLIPVAGSAFEDLPLVSNQEIMTMRKECARIMKQMYHCRQCRADAVGTLQNDRSIEFHGCHTAKAAIAGKSTNTQYKKEDGIKQEDRIMVAVATKTGMLVDQHFGQVSEFYVYEYSNGNAVFKEKRNIEKYCSGVEDCEEKESKMDNIIKTIADCDAVIAMRIGETPKQKLKTKGIRVFTTYDRIEDSIKMVASEMAIQ